jgi:hypothetical protein
MGLGKIGNNFKTLVDKFPGNFHLEHQKWIERWHCDNIKIVNTRKYGGFNWLHLCTIYFRVIYRSVRKIKEKFFSKVRSLKVFFPIT